MRPWATWPRKQRPPHEWKPKHASRGYRSKFGTTAKTAREYWNIYCFAMAIGFHSLAKDTLDAHFRVIEQELEGW